MTSQEHALSAPGVGAQAFDGSAKACLIAGSGAQGWSVRTLLAKGEIAAEDRESRGGEGFRKRNEERGLAVRSSAMGKDKGGIG
jgi:hypothetical protein